MKTAIIGGGASGLACAIELKKLSPNFQVTVYEANPRVGKKILATGNGRCNLTNLSADKSGYRNMRYAGYALEMFTPESNIKFFNSLGLFTRNDGFGRIYPLSNQASSVLDALRLSAERLGVNIVSENHVDNIDYKKGKFLVCSQEYDVLVLATGGKASPSQGSDGSGYKLLKQLGHKLTPLAPSLVQLETESKQYPKFLKGVRCDCQMSLVIDGKLVSQKNGEILFADYGLSGIVSMEMSAYIGSHFARNKTKPRIYVDFVPSMTQSELMKNIKFLLPMGKNIRVEDMLSGFMPKKIGQVILKQAGIGSDKKIFEISSDSLKEIVLLAKNFEFIISGTRGYDMAQVTSGGADTKEFDKRTMMSKKIPALYCIGELVDVDGDCGGYNLNWAWSSGRLAAKSISEL